MASAGCRILFVENSADGTVGGSHHALAGLVRRLDRARFEPRVVFYADNPLARELERDGIPVVIWEPPQRAARGLHWREAWRALARAGRCAGLLRRERIDLVHLNNSPTVSFEDWLPASRWVGVPCISHARGVESERPGVAGRLLMRRFDRVVAVSHYIREAIVAAGVPPRRVEVIHDGIDAEDFRRRVTSSASEQRSALGAGSDVVLVVMVGHQRAWKGQDVVLDALRRIRAGVRRRILLLLVGGRPLGERGYQEALQKTVADADLDERVRFLGERTDVANLMNAADVVLHASTRPEPFGLVVLEAMALGKPVVASRLGGPAEILTPESGVTFDPRRPDELAGLLERLVEEPLWRAKLGEGGFSRVERFSLAESVARVEALYDELLDRGGTHRRSGAT